MRGKRTIISSLVRELNSHFPLNLSEDFVCDRYLEDDVFQQDLVTRPIVILVGASHLSRVSSHLGSEQQVVNFTRPGWRITDENISVMAEDITEAM